MAIDDLVADETGQEELDLSNHCPVCGKKGVKPDEPGREAELKCPTDQTECGVLYWFPS